MPAFVVDLSAADLVYLGRALRLYIERLHHNGVDVSPALAAFSKTLNRGLDLPAARQARPGNRDAVPDPKARARALAAARSARSRARRRGEPVPLRRPGRPANRDGLGLAG